MDISKLKIDKGVPIVGLRGATAEWRGLIESMEFLDSVLLPSEVEKKQFAAAITAMGFGYRSRREGREWRVWKLQKHRD